MHLHPSVIMNISEHHSRTKAMRQQPEPVVGALLGKKRDHQTEIVDSFELRLVKTQAGVPTHGDMLVIDLDKEFVHKRLPLVKEVNADLDLIGWYSTATQADDSGIGPFEISLHKQIGEFIPNPIYVRLNPYRRESDPKISGSLPLRTYEPFHEIDGDRENLNLIEVAWTIVTEDVEIIGLEHNAKVTHINVTPSASVENLKLQYGAVKMLKERLEIISTYLKHVRAGSLPYHHEPIEDIIKLTQRLPVMNSEQYARAHNVQCNDVALNTYLGILTKGSMCKMGFGKPSSKMRALSSTHARR